MKKIVKKWKFSPFIFDIVSKGREQEFLILFLLLSDHLEEKLLRVKFVFVKNKGYFSLGISTFVVFLQHFILINPPLYVCVLGRQV